MRCKNHPGGSGDDGGRCPPRIPNLLKGKGQMVQKKKTSKKRTREQREAEAAERVADAADRACRGGRGGSLTIRECQSQQSGAQEPVTEETQPQGTETEEQPTQPLRCSSRVRPQTAGTSSQTQGRASRPPREPEVRHYDLRGTGSRQIKKLRCVSLEDWFPLQRQPGVDYFHTAIQEDFFRAYVDTQAPFSAQREIHLADLSARFGEDLRQYFDSTPGLADLIGRTGHYMPSWIREFYATVWIAPDHTSIHFSFHGEEQEISGVEFAHILRIPRQDVLLHQLCFPRVEPPRRAHAGVLPPVEAVRDCFRGDFGEGSSRLPKDLTVTARILDSIVRRTILPREGYKEGLTHLQQWVLSHLIRKIPFDLWDLMLCEIEDVIYEGFRTKRHMHYAHWLTYLIRMGIRPLPPEAIEEYRSSDAAFPCYDGMQLLRSATAVTPVRQSHRPPVPETAIEQDATVREIAEAEEAQLEAEQAGGVELDLDSSDSNDEDFLPPYMPRAHDAEAGSSSGARSDPAITALL